MALKKVRHCVAYSSISLRFKTALRNHLDAVKSTEKRILNPDCPTRWNSACDMILRFLNVQRHFEEVLQMHVTEDREKVNVVDRMASDAT